MNDEIYLGDGAYCKVGAHRGELVIYTHNGIHPTNSIYLERYEMKALVRFIKEKYEIE